MAKQDQVQLSFSESRDGLWCVVIDNGTEDARELATFARAYLRLDNTPIQEIDLQTGRFFSKRNVLAHGFQCTEDDRAYLGDDGASLTQIFYLLPSFSDMAQLLNRNQVEWRPLPATGDFHPHILYAANENNFYINPIFERIHSPDVVALPAAGDNGGREGSCIICWDPAWDMQRLNTLLDYIPLPGTPFPITSHPVRSAHGWLSLILDQEGAIVSFTTEEENTDYPRGLRSQFMAGAMAKRLNEFGITMLNTHRTSEEGNHLRMSIRFPEDLDPQEFVDRLEAAAFPLSIQHNTIFTAPTVPPQHQGHTRSTPPHEHTPSAHHQALLKRRAEQLERLRHSSESSQDPVTLPENTLAKLAEVLDTLATYGAVSVDDESHTVEIQTLQLPKRISPHAVEATLNNLGMKMEEVTAGNGVIIGLVPAYPEQAYNQYVAATRGTGRGRGQRQ